MTSLTSLSLKRPDRNRALISLVPMIDVMLILLVFFMVTSTYLNLDMIPAARSQDQAPHSAPAGSGDGGGALMIRVGADGIPVLRGQALTRADLETLLTAALADDPLIQVLILPSAAARTQALITVMDIAARAGVTRMRVVRLEAAE